MMALEDKLVLPTSSSSEDGSPSDDTLLRSDWLSAWNSSQEAPSVSGGSLVRAMKLLGLSCAYGKRVNDK
jgi:hypothetical protein